MTCRRKSKICGQLFCRLPQGQLKQFCGKVDYITIRSTAKTMKPGIYFHAGVTVCVEWTANHVVAVGLKSIGFCGLSGGDGLFYSLKQIIVLENFSPLQFHAVAAFLRFGACLLTLTDFFLPLLQLLQNRRTGIFFDLLHSRLFHFWNIEELRSS